MAIKINRDEVIGNSKSFKLNILIKNLLISKAKIVFINLRQEFTKALIFQYFYSKYYIKIKTNIS